MFPAFGPVTIEIWATQDAVQEWSRIFAIGSADNNKLAMGWSYGTDINTDFIQLKISSSDLVYQRDKMQPYTIGTKYHISMVIVPNGDGKSTLSWAKRDVTTGDILKSGSSVTSGNWTPGDFASRNLWLGHGYSNNDASATYDEVRIWNGAVSAEALTLSAQKGPDATAADLAEIGAAAPARTLELNSTATLEIASGTTFTQPIVKGCGTVSGGTLKVTDSLVVKAGETLYASGTVDLSGAKIVLPEPDGLESSGPFKLLKAPAGQTLTIVGTPEVVGVPSGWELIVRGDSARIAKKSFVILVR